MWVFVFVCVSFSRRLPSALNKCNNRYRFFLPLKFRAMHCLSWFLPICFMFSSYSFAFPVSYFITCYCRTTEWYISLPPVLRVEIKHVSSEICATITISENLKRNELNKPEKYKMEPWEWEAKRNINEFHIKNCMYVCTEIYGMSV